MEQKGQIDTIMSSAMESLRDMVDVNTIIGDPVPSPDGSSIIPISKVSFGFVAGGADNFKDQQKDAPQKQPFAGGAAAGVSVQPVGFLVMGDGNARVMPAQYYAPMDRIVEIIPQLMNDISGWIKDCKDDCDKQ